MSDDPIRDAVHHLVAAAPPPRPLPATAPAPLPSPRSYRWVAVVGSGLVIAAGAIAVAAWPSGDSDAPVVSDSTVTDSTLNVAPSISAAPPSTATPQSTTPDTSQPASTTSIEPTTTLAPPGPPPEVLTELPLAMPPGQFTTSPDDLIVTHADGDLWWYPGVLGDSPGDPVLLLDMPDPNVTVDEGPGPNEIDAVAGVIDGSLLYGECCEPVAGNLMALTQPTVSEPVTYGYWPTLSPDMARVATINSFAVDIWDLVGGTRTSLEIGPDHHLSNAQGLVWSRDSQSLFTLRFDEQGWEVVRFNANPPFELEASVHLDLGSPLDSADTAELIGTDTAGNLVVHIQSATATRFQSLDPTLQPVTGEWVGPSPPNAFRYELSPDGQVLLRWSDDGLMFNELGGAVHQVIFDEVRNAWFVPVASPDSI